MTYYQCGQQHYVLAYGGAGPIYMPVPAPAQPVAPPATTGAIQPTRLRSGVMVLSRRAR